MAWSLNLNWGYPLTNGVDRQRHQLDRMTYMVRWSVNNISGTWPQWWCYVSSPFIKGYHWSKFQLHSIRVSNSLLSNINDNGDNNEKTKCLRNILGRNFLDAIFPGKFTRRESDRWDFSGGSFPVRSFPDTIHIYISGCIKALYRYLVKIISDFRGICVLNDFYTFVNSTWFNSKTIPI